MAKQPLTSAPVAAASTRGAGSVEVLTVRSRRDRTAFVRFPGQIYAHDPHWACPLLLERLHFIDPRRHPFYLHGAAVQFLARRGGQIVGRIQASDDPHFNREHNVNVGCFGLFECLDDSAAASALLDAAARWLAARGRDTLWGPVDYSTNYACGLLVEGFDFPARVMMNHHPPYYEGLLLGWGLTKCRDLYSWWFSDPYDMQSRWETRVARAEARSRVTIRPLDPRRLHSEITLCKQVYNQAVQGQWGMVTMTDAELLAYGKLLAQVAPPGLMLLAEDGGRPVGLSLTLPDINEALRPLQGRLTRWGLPIGYLRLRANLKRVKTCRLMMLGVVPQFRRRGILERLIVRTLAYGKKTLHYTAAELGWTLETNDAIHHAIESVGARHYKTYRLFEARL